MTEACMRKKSVSAHRMPDPRHQENSTAGETSTSPVRKLLQMAGAVRREIGVVGANPKWQSCSVSLGASLSHHTQEATK